MLQITKYCRAENGQAFRNGSPCLPTASDSLEEMVSALVAQYHIVHSRFGKMDRLSQLGFTIAELILQDRHLAQKHEPHMLGVVLNNSAASLDTDMKYWETTSNIPSPALFVYTLPNIVVAEICIKNNFKGENFFFVSEKMDTHLLFCHISEMLNSNRAAACLGGWVEVLNNSYNAFLFLVEKDQEKKAAKFTEENIINIYNTTPLWNS